MKKQGSKRNKRQKIWHNYSNNKIGRVEEKKYMKNENFCFAHENMDNKCDKIKIRLRMSRIVFHSFFLLVYLTKRLK